MAAEPFKYKAVVHFEKNPNGGSDYIFGDIHGMFDLLSEQLKIIDFDPTKDRVFSVGDLVDRGALSHEVLDWLEKPWFHAIRGNHEQMCIEAHRTEGLTQPQIVSRRGMHVINGGDWFYEISEAQREAIVQAFETLPYAITLDACEEPVGIVHAEVPVGMSWAEFTKALENNDERVEHVAHWGRSRITYRNTSVVEGVSIVYAGHTVLPKAAKLGNHVFIDTGAVHTGRLTNACISPTNPHADKPTAPGATN